jgi:hypothetical protein
MDYPLEDKIVLEAEIVLVETKKINKYKYVISDLIPHTSVHYDIYCFNDIVFIKQISGKLEGQEYLDWTNDDYLDNFIKAKVIALQ